MGNEIYNSSNWGTGVCDNTIDWGVVYKDDAGCTPSFTNTKSLNFDGVDDYTKAGITLDSYNNAVIRTFSFWVKINTLNTYTPFFSGLGATGALFRYSNMCGVVNGKIRWQMEEGFASSGGVYIETEAVDGSGSAPNVADGNWHHVVVYNAVDSTANKANVVNCKVYLDGSELTNNIENTGTQAVRGFPKGFLCLGTGYPTSYLEGNIDEFAYWDNHELSSSDVTTIYNGGSPTDLSLFDTPPTSWYRMGDSSTYQQPQILMPENTNKDKVSNYSLNFDGVNDSIDFTDINYSATTGWSLSFWFNANTLTQAGLVGKYDTNARGVYYRTADSTLTWYDGSNKIFAFPSFSVDTWYHVLFTNDSSDLRCYVNGVESTTGALTSAIDSYFNTIGSFRGWGGIGAFNGNIDEVATFDSVISVSDVWDGSGQPKAISGATAHWKLGEQATFSTNWTVPDQVGSNDGTSANMTIEDREGNAPNSDKNALSYNMVEADIETDVPT